MVVNVDVDVEIDSFEIPAPAIYNPQSAEYRKAQRNFLKSTRARPSSSSFDWTPFRAAEKHFKAKFPPPDLSDVLDLAFLDPQRSDEIKHGKWIGRPDAYNIEPVRLLDTAGVNGRRAYIVPDVPGLVILPGYISHKLQRELIRYSLCNHARPPNESNLDTHYFIPKEGIWTKHVRSLSRCDPSSSELIHPRITVSEPTMYEVPGPRRLISNTPAKPDNFVDLANKTKLRAAPSTTLKPLSASDLLPKLRWVNIGWFYHWGTKQYDFSKEKVEPGAIIRDLCKEIVKAIDWGQVFENERWVNFKDGDLGETEPEWRAWQKTYEPDAGIINFYQLRDTLMGHVDRSEICATSPLVSVSLGNASIFLIGGLTRDFKPLSILLRSGDVVIMAGPGCRRAYHGVPRILEGTLPPHLCCQESDDDEWRPFEAYLETARINMNVRQVFPIGFIAPEIAQQRSES